MKGGKQRMKDRKGEKEREENKGGRHQKLFLSWLLWCGVQGGQTHTNGVCVPVWTAVRSCPGTGGREKGSLVLGRAVEHLHLGVARGKPRSSENRPRELRVEYIWRSVCVEQELSKRKKSNERKRKCPNMQNGPRSHDPNACTAQSESRALQNACKCQRCKQRIFAQLWEFTVSCLHTSLIGSISTFQRTFEQSAEKKTTRTHVASFCSGWMVKGGHVLSKLGLTFLIITFVLHTDNHTCLLSSSFHHGRNVNYEWLNISLPLGDWGISPARCQSNATYAHQKPLRCITEEYVLKSFYVSFQSIKPRFQTERSRGVIWTHKLQVSTAVGWE